MYMCVGVCGSVFVYICVYIYMYACMYIIEAFSLISTSC